MDMLLSFDGELLSGDLSVTDVDVNTDMGLQTAIIISLFTDRKANDDDELPAGATDRRGWWGDMLADLPEDKIGSRLWLLSREKTVPEVLARAHEYTEEALQWLLDDKVVKKLFINVTSPKMGWLHIFIGVTRFDNSRFEQGYPYEYGEAV